MKAAETAEIIAVNALGAPIARLDKDGAEVAVIPPKLTMLTTVSAGTPTHTHTVQVGGVQIGDQVVLVQGFRGQWFVVSVYS